MGSVAFAQKDYAGALASYETALRLKPDSAEALLYRGDALNGLKRLDEALGSYDRALAIKPDLAFASGSRLHVKMRICDWRDLANDFDLLGKAIGNGERVSQPFPALATPLSAALQRRCAEAYTRAKHPERPLFPQVTHRYEHDRIRLGYFSADFHNHATSYLMAELFERHDRTRFELNAFSLGPAENDAMSARLKKAFGRFFWEVGSRTDKEVALLSRSLEIDIAVDLKGFTGGSRTSIFAMRPAPIQVNYLGYPGTMGTGYIDYLIADSTLIPEDQQQHYAEKIVYLPDTYQVNDSKRLIAETRFSKAEFGLPEEGFTFCCFNKNYKVTPTIFDIWMRLLSKVEGSVLWLWEDNSSASNNLRAQAQSRGVAPDRLVFARHMPLAEHLARHRLADLFLDTLPYNAHTTASDALWAGLPVLTCLGETFPGRVAASLLNAVGLPELIARTLDDYEACALELATNPGKLLRLRQKLAANRSTTPLFDSTLFTKHIETAYVAMWTRHQAGLAPEHIYVGPEIHTV
jgi:predicted O-linked N-acetylglucosamine transferase (SPINDLY family)